LLPFIKGEVPGRPHDVLFWRTDQYVTVRSGDWKLQVSQMPKKNWLFNLAKDPTEKVNLVDKEPERLAVMQAQLAEWSKSQRKPLWPSLGAGAIAIDHSLKQPSKATDEFIYYSN
jgi:arylsulfatase A-like enzyme